MNSRPKRPVKNNHFLLPLLFIAGRRGGFQQVSQLENNAFRIAF
jgi:hypothetical protein